MDGDPAGTHEEQQERLPPFDPKLMFGGRVHKFAVNCAGCPGMLGANLFVITNDSAEVEELAFQRLGAPTLFVKRDGGVREVSQNGELVVVTPGVAELPGGGGGGGAYDCEAVVRWSIQYGMNTAFSECMRAFCAYLNCAYAGICGTMSLTDHRNRVNAICLGTVEATE
jgi:hypothetical protein